MSINPELEHKNLSTKIKNSVIYLKENIISTPMNIAMVLLLTIVIIYVGIWIINWGLINATWIATDRTMCRPNGACWAFIIEKFRFYLYGFYPFEQVWRINLAFVLQISLVILLFVKRVKRKTLIFLLYLIVFPIINRVLVYGGVFGIPVVSTNIWGGLSLTFTISILALMTSFPIGILLALGRRSNLPVIKGLSVGFIEFFRGTPFITTLFMASVVVPLFLPSGVVIDRFIRIMVGMVFFQSAYLAEVIRGGLQSIHKGQYEASQAMGLNYWQQSSLVIVPQALRVTIINIGSISTSFIKDTTLVSIIGLFDLLGIVRPTVNDPPWLGLEPEGLLFSGLLYWFVCLVVARTARYIDMNISKKTRRN